MKDGTLFFLFFIYFLCMFSFIYLYLFVNRRTDNVQKNRDNQWLKNRGWTYFCFFVWERKRVIDHELFHQIRLETTNKCIIVLSNILFGLLVFKLWSFVARFLQIMHSLTIRLKIVWLSHVGRFSSDISFLIQLTTTSELKNCFKWRSKVSYSWQWWIRHISANVKSLLLIHTITRITQGNIIA